MIGEEARLWRVPAAVLAIAGAALCVAASTAPAAAQEQPPMPLPPPRPKRARDTVLARFEVDATTIHEALHLLAEATEINAVASDTAGSRTVTLRLRGATAGTVLEALANAAGLGLREDAAAGLFRLTTTEEYQQDVVVSRAQETRVYTLLNPNAVAVASAIRDLFGERVRLTFGVDDDALSPTSATGFGGALNSGSTAARRGTTLFDGTSGEGGGNANSFAQSSGTSDGRRDRDLLRDQRLTPAQIAEIERARGAVPRAGDGDEAERAMQAAIARIAASERPISVTVQRRNNLVIVRTGDLGAFSEIERLIAQMDRPTPQVLLEIRILEAELGDEFRSVFDVQDARGAVTSGPPTSQPRNPLLPSSPDGPRSVGGLGNFPLDGGTLVYQFMNDRLLARVQLLEGERRLSVIGSPVILCANDAEAQLFIGEERPLVRNFTLQSSVAQGVVSDRVVPQVEVQDIGNTIRIRPRINADRTVTLLIALDASTANVGGASIPVPLSGGGVQQVAVDTVNTTNLEATIVGKDGLSLAIGGLVRKESFKSTSQVPLLGDVPILGALFRREVETHSRKELLLIVTPHVLTTPLEGQTRSQERLRALSNHAGLTPDALRPEERTEK